jgi:hypothetical protein
MGCRRRVCFFAHQECELRRLPEGSQLPGTTSPAAQLQADFATEAAVLQGQAQLAQALHSYIDLQTRARQEEAITAAAQLLDPLAKLRLLRALQDQTSLTSLSSLVDGSGGVEGIDPSLLAAMSALHMAPGNGIAAAAATTSRHSIDGGYGGVANAFSGAFTNASAPIAPLTLPAAGRRSIDIGSLSRTIDPFTTHNAALKLQAFASASREVDAAAAASQFLGAASFPTMPGSFGDFSTSRVMLNGSSPAGVIIANTASGNGTNTSSSSGDGTVPSSSSSEAAERSTSCGASGLQSIDELAPIRDDESTSCSSASAVARSVSAGSNLDGSGKESANGTTGSNGSCSGSGGSSSRDSSPPEVPRVMSFDNLLSELPRSASQVNMVGLASLGIS